MLAVWYEAIADGRRFELFNNQRTYEYAMAMGFRHISPCACPPLLELATDPGPYVTELLTPQKVATRPTLPPELPVARTLTAEVDCEDCVDEPTTIVARSNGLEEPPTTLDEGLGLDMLPGISQCLVVPDAGFRGCSFGDPDLPFSVAPWWDDNYPASFDFAGVMLHEVGGWNGSLLRQPSPHAFDGSSFSLHRRDGRCLTFSLDFIARSAAGLEYGVAFYDGLLNLLAECGRFDLVTANRCPSPDEDPLVVARHLRQVAVTAGIEVGRVRTSGGHAKRRQYIAEGVFSLCSESPWIFEEPQVQLDKSHAELSCVDAFPCPTPQPVYEQRDMLVERKRYPISLQRCGGVCKIGDWDWRETQLAGGDGVVVIADFEEAEGPECTPYQVILIFDAETGETGFSTLRWSSDGSIPCDCIIQVEQLIVRNPSYDPCKLECEGNERWQMIAPETGDTNCLVELNFSSGECGTWTPIGWSLAPFVLPPCELIDCCPEEPEEGEGGEDCPPPNGLTPPTMFARVCGDPRMNPFPPIGCTLTIDTSSCEGKNCQTQEDCLIDIDIERNLWTPRNFKRDCNASFPVSTCNYRLAEEQDTGRVCRRQEVLIDLPPCAVIPEGKEDVPSLLFPTYDMGSCDEGCFETVALPVDPYQGRSCYESPAKVASSCKELRNESPSFSQVLSAEILTGSSEMRNFRMQAWKKTADGQPSPCEVGATSNPGYDPQQCEYLACAEKQGFLLDNEGYIVIAGFGEFELEVMWGAYANCLGVPQVADLTVDGAYRPDLTSEWIPLPFSPAGVRLETEGQPPEWTEDGEEIELEAASSPFTNAGPLTDPTVCNEYTGSFYCELEPAWSMEVAPLPENTILTFDGETGRLHLQRPGHDPEPGERYVSGLCGQAFDPFVLEPCTSYFLQIEMDCDNTADNAAVRVQTSTRAGASGALTRGGGVQASSGAAL